MSLHGSKECKKVVLYTQNHRIEGEIYLHSNVRLNDELNNNARQRDFIAVTSAKIYSVDGDVLLRAVDYLNVNKSFIEMLIDVSSGEVDVSLYR